MPEEMARFHCRVWQFQEKSQRANMAAPVPLGRTLCINMALWNPSGLEAWNAVES